MTQPAPHTRFLTGPETGRQPNGSSYRALPRLYQRLNPEIDLFAFPNAHILCIDLHVRPLEGAGAITEAFDAAVGTRHLIIATFNASFRTRQAIRA